MWEVLKQKQKDSRLMSLLVQLLHKGYKEHQQRRKKYMTNQLNVNAYPLHLLVNKEGKVVKATNSIEDMIPYFEKEAG